MRGKMSDTVRGPLAPASDAAKKVVAVAREGHEG
jgi:hypothetical protein